jgi:hypothetical protein
MSPFPSVSARRHDESETEKALLEFAQTRGAHSGDDYNAEFALVVHASCLQGLDRGGV